MYLRFHAWSDAKALLVSPRRRPTLEARRTSAIRRASKATVPRRAAQQYQGPMGGTGGANSEASRNTESN